MDDQIKQYIEGLVEECMKVPAFSSLPDDQKQTNMNKLRDHFFSAVFATLLENMDNEQLEQLKGVDPTSPEGLQKIEVIAASIPGLGFVVEERLQKEKEIILQTQKITEITPNV